MITIFHGDNEVLLQDTLVREIENARKRHADIVRLDGKKAELSDLERSIGTDVLFSSEKLVIVERLFSLPKSKRKDALFSWMREHSTPETALFLIEKKLLTATQLKVVPEAKVVAFKHPKVLFQLMESLGTLPPAKMLPLFHAVLEREDVEFVFIMLIRQVRVLLSFVSSGTFDGPPFLRAKLAFQAKHFTKEKLLVLHSQLLYLDEQQKTSKNPLPLAHNLDLVLVQM